MRRRRGGIKRAEGGISERITYCVLENKVSQKRIEREDGELQPEPNYRRVQSVDRRSPFQRLPCTGTSRRASPGTSTRRREQNIPSTDTLPRPLLYVWRHFRDVE